MASRRQTDGSSSGRGAIWALVLLGVVAAGCEAGPRQRADGGVDAPAERPDYLERLTSPADYGLVQGEGGEVKYLLPVGGATMPAAGLAGPSALFQNTERFPGHITFLKSFPELAGVDFATYLTFVMKRASRVLWGGSLKHYPGERHPRTGAPGILVYFAYSDPNDVDALTVDELVEIDTRLKSAMPYARDLLVLVGMDQDQAARFEAQRAALTARGVALVDLRELHAGITAEGYSLGEGYGYLKIVPRGVAPQAYGPRDVLITESSTDELSLVAGLVTATPQNLHSHVNLRLQEKQIPNAYVSDIYENTVVTMLAGSLVHVVVTASAVQIDPALPATAQAFWDSHRPGTPAIRADLSVTDLRDFSSLRGADAVAFGTKAANLGELHRALPAPNRVAGFAIPFSAYRDFMLATGAQTELEALLADPRVLTDATYRDQRLSILEDGIKDATVPPDLLARLQAAARAALGDAYATVPLRIRSSSNAEDGEMMSGAGLYDSARGCFADDLDGDTVGPSACLSAAERAGLEAELGRRRSELTAHPERTWLLEVIDDLTGDLSNERSVARALKKVYASLWTRRAFEERAYWGLDQLGVYMGAAVHPAFVLERLDAVAVTNLTAPGGADAGTGGGEAGAAGPVYRVVSQMGGESVVRPVDPSAVAETVTFVRDPSGTPANVVRLTASSLSPDPLWSSTRLAELAGLLFTVHDHFATYVYPERARLSLDLEIKLTSDDRIVIKQARPFIEPQFP